MINNKEREGRKGEEKEIWGHNQPLSGQKRRQNYRTYSTIKTIVYQ